MSASPTAGRSAPFLLRRCLAAAVLSVAAAAAVAGGTVAVSFAPTEHFTDAGGSSRERTDNLLNLSLHLQRLGQRLLPDGQSLKIEVLDVDLAGWNKPFIGRGRDVRVLNGGADWPRIALRWTLVGADGGALGSGSETVSDMDYLMGASGRFDSDPLRYEKVMLNRWFGERFGGGVGHGSARS